MWQEGFVCPQIREFRFRLFASTTLNHELKTVFPSTGATNPFCVRMFCGQDFFVSQNQKRILTNNTCLGIFRVVTFQSKTGRFVARNFSRTRGKFDLRREATQPPAPHPLPPARKKTTAPLPSVKTRGVSPKRWSFRGTSVVTFMKTLGTFMPARLKVF